MSVSARAVSSYVFTEGEDSGQIPSRRNILAATFRAQRLPQTCGEVLEACHQTTVFAQPRSRTTELTYCGLIRENGVERLCAVSGKLAREMVWDPGPLVPNPDEPNIGQPEQEIMNEVRGLSSISQEGWDRARAVIDGIMLTIERDRQEHLLKHARMRIKVLLQFGPVVRRLLWTRVSRGHRVCLKCRVCGLELYEIDFVGIEVHERIGCGPWVNREPPAAQSNVVPLA